MKAIYWNWAEMGRRGRGELSVCGSRWGGGRAAEDCGRGEVQGGWRGSGAGWLSTHGRGEVKCRNEGGGLATGGEISLL